ncbi:MAG: S41 family peptidase [Tannerellaceae bacterium]|jgi:carboxyl-terminal processing protease|nr:S41 family peptidase [Tannerellaceae bacterium]
MIKIARSLPFFFLALSLATQAAGKDITLELRKIQTAFYAISSFYVDSVDDSKVVEDAITAMLEKLDPHSTYADPVETKDMNESMQGNFDGIGIQFNMLTDTLYVIQVIAGGPAEKVGLVAGDRIILVDDTVIAGVKMKTTDIMKRLRGPKGTQVTVQVQRNRKPELLEYRIIRDKIPVHSLDAAYMLDKTTGYVKLNRFAATTADEFRTALDKLRKEGMKNLILDLQGNGGGVFGAAVSLAEDFLATGQLIVYTEGRSIPREEVHAGSEGCFRNGRLAILVDESSASAAEILTGAVQDWKRGIVVGRRTFGKGLVQKPIALPDGSMIRLTVSRYYTPNGRSIQKPYESGKEQEYRRDLIERYNRGELMNADSIHGPGGIMPDFFIPLDTSLYTDYHRKINAAGLLNRLTMNYIDANRTSLAARYRNPKVYREKYIVDTLLLGQLLNLAEADSIPFDAEQYNHALPLITLQIKALIARDLYDTADYYRIINDNNDSLREALRLINSPQDYARLLAPRKEKEEDTDVPTP